MFSRRTFLQSIAIGGLLGTSVHSNAAADPLPAAGGLRIGLTPVFLDDQAAFLARWRGYLDHRLARPVVFVQRGSYREIIDLVRTGGLDFAWVCGFPFVRYAQEMTLLAVPLYRGKPLYQSYLIVPTRDARSDSIADLRGKVFAYSDPDSNSGFLYPRYVLKQMGAASETFFGKSFFTWAHRKVVEAVSIGLAQGGAVDGYVWDTLSKSHPELTVQTRIVTRSPEFGHPPFVARLGIDQSSFLAMQQVLMGMTTEPEGRTLLAELNLDGFVAGTPRLFDGIAQMVRAVGQG
jgi:phosphonate transport system substrate-binding protein